MVNTNTNAFTQYTQTHGFNTPKRKYAHIVNIPGVFRIIIIFLLFVITYIIFQENLLLYSRASFLCWEKKVTFDLNQNDVLSVLYHRDHKRKKIQSENITTDEKEEIISMLL